MYLEIDEGFLDHPKTIRFCALMQNPEASIYLIRLWTWACRSAPDGNLSGMGSYEVEMAVRYRLLDGKCYDAMVRSGFVDVTEDGCATIHNWATRTGAAIKRMAAKAQALRQRRLHAKGECDPELCPTCTGTEPAQSPERSGDDPPSPVQSSPDKTSQDPERTVPVDGNAPATKRKRVKPAPDYTPEFERLWAETGRSGNKLPAFEAWLGNGSPSVDDVIAGWRHAERHDRRWQGPNPHIPHLSTWLNDRGWEDRPMDGARASPSQRGESVEEILARQRAEREQRRLEAEFLARRAAEIRGAVNAAD